MFIYRFCTVSNKPNENNKLKPITTVSIDLVLPKIDLEIEHVLRLKTHGVENRRRFSTSKIGAHFRLQKQTWPKKTDDDAVAAAFKLSNYCKS